MFIIRKRSVFYHNNKTSRSLNVLFHIDYWLSVTLNKMSCPSRIVVSRPSEYTFKNENRVWELEFLYGFRSSINLVQYSLAERQIKGFKLVQENMLTGWFWFDGTSSPYADINQNTTQPRNSRPNTISGGVFSIKSNTSVLRLIEFLCRTSWVSNFLCATSWTTSGSSSKYRAEHTCESVFTDMGPRGDGGHICQKHQLLCQGSLATLLYLATVVTSQRASDNKSRFSVWCQTGYPWTVSLFPSGKPMTSS